MKTIILLCSFIVVFFMQSCEDRILGRDSYKTVNSEAYVAEYLTQIDYLTYKVRFNNNDDTTCRIVICPCKYTFVSTSYVCESEYIKYKTLCKKHSDTNYIRPIRLQDPPGLFCGYSYLDLDPVKIEIISDKDFDDEHPAGTSLGDLFYFRSVTPYPFIKNGYSGEEFTLINKRLNELTAEEMILSMFKELVDWGNQKDKDRIPQYIKEVMNYNDNQIMKMPPHFALLRSDFPTKEKVHTLTITITDDYGNKFTNTCTVDFNEAGS